MAPFESVPDFQNDALAAVANAATLGLTVIVSLPLSAQQLRALKLRVS
jgi:hypothetical protein